MGFVTHNHGKRVMRDHGVVMFYRPIQVSNHTHQNFLHGNGVNRPIRNFAGFRVVQQVVDEQTHAVGRLHDELQTLGALLVELGCPTELYQLSIGSDGAQGLPEIVRGGVREVLQLGIGSRQQFGMPGQRRGRLLFYEFGFPSLGNIAKDQHHTGDVALGPRDRSGAVFDWNLTAVPSDKQGATGSAGRIPSRKTLRTGLPATDPVSSSPILKTSCSGRSTASAWLHPVKD